MTARNHGFLTYAGCGVVVFGLLGLAACGGPGTSNNTTQPRAVVDAKVEDYPKLQRQLFDLAVAGSGSSQGGGQSGPEVKDGFVQIVIVLEDAGWVEDARWALEALGGRFETSANDSVQAWVPLAALLPLATHPRVNFVRLPVKPRVN